MYVIVHDMYRNVLIHVQPATCMHASRYKLIYRDSFHIEKVTDSSGGYAVLCNINPSQGLVPRPNNFCGLDDVTSANKRPTLDSQFQIPTEYSTEIMAGLKKGELNVYERLNMMREVAIKVAECNPHPTMDELKMVSSQVFQAWPFLAKYGMGVSEFYVCIYSNLNDLYCFMQDYFSFGVLEQLKTLHTSKPLESAVMKLDPARKEISSYAGDNSFGEDIHSANRHIDFMKMKMSQKKKNLEKLFPFMALTFTNRRDWITKEAVSVSTILDTYPVLGSIEGVCMHV